jgi:type II secretion system protein N
MTMKLPSRLPLKLPARLPALEGWKRRAAYGAFFALAFLFALQRTFPTEAVKERLVLEAAALGWQVRMAGISPSGFGGVRMRDVTLEWQEGTRIPLEEARASLRLWPLLLGRRGLAFDFALYGGRLSGFAEQGPGTQRLALRGEGIDLGRASAVRKAVGIDLAGTLRADVDVTLDARDPAKSAGRIDLSVDKAAVNGGEVPVPGMGGNVSLPRMSLGTVVAKAAIRAGRAEFEKLEAKSEDVEASADPLYFMAQPRLEYAPLVGRAKVKLSDGFWQKSGTAGLRGVVEMALASAKGRDGAYGFQIYGTLGHPQAKPAAQ